MAILYPKEKHGVAMAFYFMEVQIRAARVQQQRIQRGYKRCDAIVKDVKEERRRPGLGNVLTDLSNDIHFYLISASRLLTYAEYIATETRFPELGRVMRRYRRELKDLDTFRDHLEHMEERLPGGKKRHTLAKPWDMGNMAGEHFTIGGKAVNIGKDSWRLLTLFWKEFTLASLYDACTIIGEADQAVVAQLIQTAARDIDMRAFLRRLERNNWEL